MSEVSKTDDSQQILIPAADAQVYMKHIKELMPLLGVDFDPTAIKPVRSVVHDGPLPHGQVRIGILVVLRKHKDWMTVQQLSDAVLARHGKALSRDVEKKFQKVLRESVFFMHQAGTLERELDLHPGFGSQHRQRYRLSRKRFRQ